MTEQLDVESLIKRSKELNIDVNEVMSQAFETLEKKKRDQDVAQQPAQVSDDKSKLDISNIPPHILDEVWRHVQIARHVDRPTTLEYVDHISEQFIELRGDRISGDDNAMVGGICTINGIHFTFIGTQKGSNMKENISRNYGMAHPEGYRKALRLAKQAEHFQRPLVTFIDTSGAFPGIAAEERGIGEAIARNLQNFSVLRTPIICIIIGEGGSGGALGIGVGDRIYMLEHSIYSVISPEGFSSILLRDVKKTREAATFMKMTAQDVLEAGFIDGIIPEPLGGAHEDFVTVAEHVKTTLLNAYDELRGKEVDQLVRLRSQKIIDWTREHISTNYASTNSSDLLSRIRKLFG